MNNFCDTKLCTRTRLFLLLVICVIFSKHAGAQQPAWVKTMPQPSNNTYYFINAKGNGKNETEARANVREDLRQQVATKLNVQKSRIIFTDEIDSSKDNNDIPSDTANYTINASGTGKTIEEAKKKAKDNADAIASVMAGGNGQTLTVTNKKKSLAKQLPKDAIPIATKNVCEYAEDESNMNLQMLYQVQANANTSANFDATVSCDIPAQTEGHTRAIYAACLSLELPGLGQMYRGRPKNAIEFFVPTALCVGAGLWMNQWKNSDLQKAAYYGGPNGGANGLGDPIMQKKYADRSKIWQTISYVALGVGAAIWITNIVHAVIISQPETPNARTMGRVPKKHPAAIVKVIASQPSLAAPYGGVGLALCW